MIFEFTKKSTGEVVSVRDTKTLIQKVDVCYTSLIELFRELASTTDDEHIKDGIKATNMYAEANLIDDNDIDTAEQFIRKLPSFYRHKGITMARCAIFSITDLMYNEVLPLELIYKSVFCLDMLKALSKHTYSEVMTEWCRKNKEYISYLALSLNAVCANLYVNPDMGILIALGEERVLDELGKKINFELNEDEDYVSVMGTRKSITDYYEDCMFAGVGFRPFTPMLYSMLLQAMDYGEEHMENLVKACACNQKVTEEMRDNIMLTLPLILKAQVMRTNFYRYLLGRTWLSGMKSMLFDDVSSIAISEVIESQE